MALRAPNESAVHNAKGAACSNLVNIRWRGRVGASPLARSALLLRRMECVFFIGLRVQTVGGSASLMRLNSFMGALDLLHVEPHEFAALHFRNHQLRTSWLPAVERETKEPRPQLAFCSSCYLTCLELNPEQERAMVAKSKPNARMPDLGETTIERGARRCCDLHAPKLQDLRGLSLPAPLRDIAADRQIEGSD
jgi:hypothetical protein